LQNRFLRHVLTGVVLFVVTISALAQDPLPSWNDGAAKQAILNFVKTTTDPASASFVPVEQRIATFDQDGTTWVEHPIYTEIVFSFERIVALAPQHPEWKTTEPFRTILSGDQAAIGKLPLRDLKAIIVASHSGMSVEQFNSIVNDWITTAKDARWHRLYTDLVYQPMLELMRYLRANGYKTYIVTGGGQEFVRAYAERVYGVPPEQVVGSALETQYTYASDGKGILMRSPTLLLNDNFSGKAEDIYLFTGRHAKAAFGNSTGDQQMLEYTQSGSGATLMMLVMHDDAQREYAYGPAAGLPDTKVGAFTQPLYDEAKSRGWTVISMKKDWRRIFGFEE
jgi:phosphoserine phosphatase